MLQEIVLVFATLVVFFMLGYMLGTAHGEKNERTKWLRWIISGIQEMRMAIGDSKEETADVLEEMVEKAL